MRRICGVGLLLLALFACRLPPDQTPLKPLPEDGQIFTYDEILGRARVQASVALDAFYVDNWPELADAARSLEQTARFLPKTSDPPTRIVSKLVKEAVVLQKDAVLLDQAAKAKDVNNSIEALQRIFLKIRQLRPEPAAKKKETTKDTKK